MVDAPNWGQDWQGVMRDNAKAVYAADTTGNLIFSIHMYSVFDTAQEITDYLNAFVDAKLPLLSASSEARPTSTATRTRTP